MFIFIFYTLTFVTHGFNLLLQVAALIVRFVFVTNNVRKRITTRSGVHKLKFLLYNKINSRAEHYYLL